jgi:hypothetical protein
LPLAIARIHAQASFYPRHPGPELKPAEEVREHFLREFHIANIIKHAAKLLQSRRFGWSAGRL